jgi:hypothetical protein
MKTTVTIELLCDSWAPNILAVAIDDVRITPSKHSGQWDSVRKWRRVRVEGLLAALGISDTNDEEDETDG